MKEVKKYFEEEKRGNLTEILRWLDKRRYHYTAKEIAFALTYLVRLGEIRIEIVRHEVYFCENI